MEIMHDLAECAWRYIRKHALLRAGDSVGLAVSGGADSVAMLLVMTELRARLGIVPSIVHFNHKLRGAESEADEQFVRDLSQRHDLQFFHDAGRVADEAAKSHSSVETAAKTLRYEYFARLLETTKLNCIATAHTLDDQAETVLLKMVRGAGTRGLSAIYPKLPMEQPSGPAKSIIRPFLDVQRKDIEDYLLRWGQEWREDKSNRDVRHSRNMVRHVVLPTIAEHMNPSVRRTLAEAAEIARAEEQYWIAEMRHCLPHVWEPLPENRAGKTGGKLSIAGLSGRPLAMRRRIIRAAAQTLGLELEFQHVEQILNLASSDLGENQSTVLPEGWAANREAKELFLRRNSKRSKSNADYEYVLPVPGRVFIAEAGRVVEAALIESGCESGYNPDHALDIGLLGNELRVRNWRPGDRFWPRHSKGPKKVKELLQERHLTGPDRQGWPVVVRGSEVVWMSGFPAHATMQPGSGKAVIIHDRVL